MLSLSSTTRIKRSFTSPLAGFSTDRPIPQQGRMSLIGHVQRLLLSTVVLCSVTPIAAFNFTDMNGWYNCSTETFASDGAPPGNGSAAAMEQPPPSIWAECALVQAPLCYPGICANDTSKSTINLFFKRIKAVDSPETKPNVWFIQGGPGAASDAMEGMMTNLFGLLNGQVNVYTIDHRGTGRSNKFDCVASQATTSGSPGGEEVTPDEAPACASDLQEAYGNDLSGFSITSAATDLATFIQTYQANTPVFVYGVSYGTSVVERLIHLGVKEIKGYILDGISTASGSDLKNFEYFSTWDSDYGEIGDHFLDLCTKDSFCSSKFKKENISQVLTKVLMRVDKEPEWACSKLLSGNVTTKAKPGSPKPTGPSGSTPVPSDPPSFTLRRLLGGMLGADMSRPLIPSLIYRFGRCNEVDQEVLASVFSSDASQTPSSPSDVFMSGLLYNLILFSDMWEQPTPDEDTMRKRFSNTLISSGGMYKNVKTYCAFTKENSNACARYNVPNFTASPIVYKRDKYWNKAAAIPQTASALIMSSKLDPQTPHKYAEFLLNALNGTSAQKQLVTFVHATHGVAMSATYPGPDGSPRYCGLEIVASYVSNDGNLANLDTSCLAVIPPLNFTEMAVMAAGILNTTDSFDGKPVNTAAGSDGAGSKASSGYKTAFIVVAVLLGLFLIAFGVIPLASGNTIWQTHDHRDTSLKSVQGWSKMSPIDRAKRLLLSVIVVLCSVKTVAAFNFADMNGWYNCSTETFAAEGDSSGNASAAVQKPPPSIWAECALVKAPLCYPGVCADDSSKHMIDLFFKRITAATESPETKPNVWFIQGGPGAASDAMEGMMINLYNIMGAQVNVYTVDHRGTGRSNRFDCVASQALTSGSPGGEKVINDETAACASDLQATYGSDLSGFSITSAATDIATFIRTYQVNMPVFVYGVSYGSAVVERLIHFGVKEIKGYILDGISTASGSDAENVEYFSTWDTDYGEVGNRFLALCTKDAFCSSNFKGENISQVLIKVLARIDKEPQWSCSKVLNASTTTNGKPSSNPSRPSGSNPDSEAKDPPSFALRKLLGNLLGSSSRALIPPLIYRFERCNEVDQEVLTAALTSNTPQPSRSPSDVFMSDLLYNLILFSEMWEQPTPDEDTMRKRYSDALMSDGGMFQSVKMYCAFTKEDSTACARYNIPNYKASPIVYKRDKFWNKAAVIPPQASVLIMSSKLDPQTPHKYAELLLSALNGTSAQKKLVTFEDATHGVAISSAYTSQDGNPHVCGMEIIASYANAGGDLAKMDASCVAAMPSLNFTKMAAYAADVLNTADSFDGKLLNTNSSTRNDSNKTTNSSSQRSTSSKSNNSYKTAFMVVVVLLGLLAIAFGVVLSLWRAATRTDKLTSMATPRRDMA
ncbi:TPA: LOW QUALITY PROTEIN: hypothetical protein N0F65_000780 [Lagenidium giganteum]|uniref:AB hydrolase-1 domain-containing protein n=1 Tax=Lagenidium giganteum TaxID=4803 RepID=A0AAV2ZEP1_9STRA|nr:TPA: LOW QUALITY PROTEIN: hypothetical protein N0F65_000780 [Lagenidium giganteum]